MKIRAIYISDVRYNECPVFELNEKTKEFVMLDDKEIKYHLTVVEEDNQFIVFQVEHEEVEMISKRSLMKYYKSLEDQETNKMMNEIVHKNAEALKKLGK